MTQLDGELDRRLRSIQGRDDKRDMGRAFVERVPAAAADRPTEGFEFLAR